MERPPQRINPEAAAAALLVLVLLAYLPALGAGFIWDDDDHVTENPTLRTVDGLRRIWLEIGAVPQYYPVVHTTFWIEYRLWGLAPLGYHLTNVLLHALSAILLWCLLRRLAIPGAWLAAAVFALHPVHVESVAWVTERKNVLSAAFYLAAAHAWLSFRPLDGDRPAVRETWRGYAAVVALFLGALLSKTVTATFPAAMLLIVWWKTGRVPRRQILPAAPLLAVGAAMGVLTAWMERSVVGAAGGAWDLTFAERLLVAGRAAWFYAAKLVWPRPLIFIYPRWPIDAGSAAQYLPPIAAASVLVLLWAMRGRIGRAPLAGSLFFVGTLFPALGFLNVYPMRYSFVADHFQYLASLGVLVPVVGCAAASIPDRGPWHRSAPVLGAALLAVLGALTLRQSAVYSDPETLWRDTLAKNPGAFSAHNNLGALLLARGDTREAREHFEQAARIAPDAPEAYDNLGIVLHEEGRYAEAIELYRKALDLDPLFADAHNNLAITLAAVGKLDEAVFQFEEAIRARPSFARARYNLGLALLRLGRADAAFSALAEAARYDPADPDIARAREEAAARRSRP